MKFQWAILLSIMAFPLAAQDLETANIKLKADFTKLAFYAERKFENDNYDSIDKYNIAFEKKLLKYCASIPETLTYDFKDLIAIGLNISTSENGLFRIYFWDTEMGGTMHSFRNVFQFKSDGKLFSQKLLSDFDDFQGNTFDSEKDDFDSTFSYEILDQVASQNQIFYVVKCLAIGSSAASSHKIKIFSIENGKLDEDAKLIKTKTGIKNELGYNIDFSSSVNQNIPYDKMEMAWLKYEKKTKIILIPLLTEDGKLTKKKIKYQFKGVYFEKI